ncbi:MAG: N-acetylmuramoyl-L-alanine amidase [Gemmatimonadetes bacterium]|nr:N-acetylmuramoyl-L-alanine amidase [Gemmatimonadota bacterium]
MIRSAAFIAFIALGSGCAGFSIVDRSRSATTVPAPPVAVVPVALAKPGLPERPKPEVWKRPPGPYRVALQAGHWRSAEAPEEQAQLRVNGTTGGGLEEWKVNLGIARKTADLLRSKGYLVDLLPTTIPPGYWADLFIAIHADGHPSPSVSGYRAAAPRRDATGRAEAFAALLERSYGEATGLPLYPLVTRRMRGYYAFNNRAYEHALDSMTVGVILETGFLSSPRDRSVIVNAQDRAARGIAAAVMRFLEPMPVEPRPIPQAD